MRSSFLHTLILLTCLLATGLAGPAGLSAAQPEEKRAGLVIQFPDGATQTFCLAFEGDSITGLDLLLKSGLEVKVEVQGLGVLVCQIGPTGCDFPAQPCVCQSYGPGGAYWSYHHLKDGRWRTSAQGAGTYRVSPGDVEGWAWSGGKPPPLYTFSQLCPALQPPTALPEPATPPAPPTDTPRPTDTPLPPDPTITAVVERQPTNTRQPTRTPQPPPQKASATPTPTPTELEPTDTPTLTPTDTTTATYTTEPSSTPTRFPTSTPTSTPSATPTLTPAPTTTPQPPPASREDTARTIGMLIAGGVLGALGLWALLTLLRRRRSPGGDGGAA
ncbi:MAG: hypothetical protein WCD37_13130 [Chloroflexia bacterium]